MNFIEFKKIIRWLIKWVLYFAIIMGLLTGGTVWYLCSLATPMSH